MKEDLPPTPAPASAAAAPLLPPVSPLPLSHIVQIYVCNLFIYFTY